MDIRDRKEQLAIDILKLTRLRLQMKLPVMSGALLRNGRYLSVLESGGGAPLVSRCTDTGGEEISASGSSLPVSSSAAGTSR